MATCLSILCVIQWNDGRNRRSSNSKNLNPDFRNADVELIETKALQDYDSLLIYFKEKGIDIEKLPGLPEGLIPEELIEKKLSEITNCSLLNPMGKKLSSLQAASVLQELTHWQGMMRTLDSEFMLEILKAKEQLFQAKEFIDYLNGDHRKAIEGVLTLGEPIEGGMRIYYYYPEEFPKIYEIRRMKKDIARICSGRLVSIINSA